MKKVFALVLLLVAGSVFADGARLVQQHCMGCHMVDGQGGDKGAAPPMFAVWHHYHQAHPDKEAFIAALSGWLTDPAESRAVMQGAVKKFGMMEQLPLLAEDARTIASYLQERQFELPDWYLNHYNDNHGKVSHGYTRAESH